LPEKSFNKLGKGIVLLGNYCSASFVITFSVCGNLIIVYVYEILWRKEN